MQCCRSDGKENNKKLDYRRNECVLFHSGRHGKQRALIKSYYKRDISEAVAGGVV